MQCPLKFNHPRHFIFQDESCPGITNGVPLDSSSAVIPWRCPRCGSVVIATAQQFFDHMEECDERPRGDTVNHPRHYNVHPSGIECIEVTRHFNFNIGNAIKYEWRAGEKEGADAIEDLEKAIWYLKDEIEMRRKKRDDERRSDQA